MAFFKKYNGTTDLRLLRLERLRYAPTAQSDRTALTDLRREYRALRWPQAPSNANAAAAGQARRHASNA